MSKKNKGKEKQFKYNKEDFDILKKSIKKFELMLEEEYCLGERKEILENLIKRYKKTLEIHKVKI